jgi:hypothetical protein
MTTAKNSGSLPIKSFHECNCSLSAFDSNRNKFILFFKPCMLQACLYLYPFMLYTYVINVITDKHNWLHSTSKILGYVTVLLLSAEIGYV